MELAEAIENQFTMIIDPSSFDYGDPTTFVSNYWRENLDLAVVAKNELGRVYYKSFSAPKDPNSPEYFSTFTQIASEFEIPIHAVMHDFGDAFMGSDPNYAVHKGGQEIQQFVCPSNSSYWRYLSTIAKEICQHQISSLILAEHYYPRLDYCFCRRCRVEFSKISGQEMSSVISLTVEDLLKDEDLLFAWVDWRTELLNNSLSEIVDTVRSEKPNLPIYTIVPVDPELDWLTGASMHLGVDFSYYNEVLNGVILAIMPYSPVYPVAGSESWTELKKRIETIKQKNPNLQIGLLLEGLEQEWDVSWFKDLHEAIGSFKMFGKMTQGQLYNVKRDLHRGLVTETY